MESVNGVEVCPRRMEDGAGPGSPFWKDQGDTYRGTLPGPRACSYCGSMHPDDFMKAAKGGALLGPTDKDYKVYVGPQIHEKFYFQHLSVDQRKEFVSMLNHKSLNIDFPGRFYVLPFFITTGAPK